MPDINWSIETVAHADTLADLDIAQRHLIVFVRSQASFYYYNTGALEWQVVGESNFRPDDLTDLVFWYEMRNTGFSYADLAPVTAVMDLSPNGNHVDTITDFTYRTNSGDPYMEMGSSNAYNGGFDVASILDVTQPDEFSAFFITYYDFGASGTQANSPFTCGTNPNLFRVLNPFSDGRLYIGCGNAFAAGQPSTAPIGETFDLIFHVWEFHRNGLDVECFADGVAVGSFLPFDAASLADAGPERMYVFGSHDFNGGRSKYKAGILYKRYLPTDERQRVRNYLAGIQ